MSTDYSSVAKLLANPARSAVVDALMEGRALAAGELARVAGVRASTISEHLAELVDGGLLAVIPAGRHRYYQLASVEVADALEALGRICGSTPVRSLRQSAADRSTRLARLCYDHLAGALGVVMLDRMLGAGWLTDRNDTVTGQDFDVTDAGAEAFAKIGVDVARCRSARRNFAPPCLDWTQRRAHLAGALGAATASALLDRGWLRRASTGRGMHVTLAGEQGLEEMFKISIHELGSDS